MTIEECIRRTEEQQALFATLPDEAIDLSRLLSYTGVWTNWMDDPCSIPHTSCNTVGCVQGWILVYLRKHPMCGVDESIYMGLGEWWTKTSCYMFLGRQRYDITEKAEGLWRYATRLKELRKLQNTIKEGD